MYFLCECSVHEKEKKYHLIKLSFKLAQFCCNVNYFAEACDLTTRFNYLHLRQLITWSSYSCTKIFFNYSITWILLRVCKTVASK